MIESRRDVLPMAVMVLPSYLVGIGVRLLLRPFDELFWQRAPELSTGTAMVSIWHRFWFLLPLTLLFLAVERERPVRRMPVLLIFGIGSALALAWLGYFVGYLPLDALARSH